MSNWDEPIEPAATCRNGVTRFAQVIETSGGRTRCRITGGNQCVIQRYGQEWPFDAPKEFSSLPAPSRQATTLPLDLPARKTPPWSSGTPSSLPYSKSPASPSPPTLWRLAPPLFGSEHNLFQPPAVQSWVSLHKVTDSAVFWRRFRGSGQ